MDSTTQQNAALVEEAAAASEAMAEQAALMSELVGFFRVDESHVATSTPVHRAVAETVTPGTGYGGVERRSEDRPWKEKNSSDETKEPAALATGTGDDESWEEF